MVDGIYNENTNITPQSTHSCAL